MYAIRSYYEKQIERLLEQKNQVELISQLFNKKNKEVIFKHKTSQPHKNKNHNNNNKNNYNSTRRKK